MKDKLVRMHEQGEGEEVESGKVWIRVSDYCLATYNG
jgi:hypothetical protein